MQDFSLKFFSRNIKLSQNEELLLARYENQYKAQDKKRPASDRNYKLEALGLLTYLQMLLFSDGETGFYYDVSGNRFPLLANKLGIPPKQLTQLLNWCFEYSILDEMLYQRYNILTSYKMQDDYSRVLDKPQDRVRAQNINMDYVYQDCDFTQKYKNALQKYLNAVQKKENAQQKTGEETRPEESKSIEYKETQPTSSFSLDDLKNKFPTKVSSKQLKVQPNMDLSLLAKKMEEQTWLLDKNNLDLAWCLKHYDDIINNRYAPGTNGKQPALTQNYKNRDYSDKDLNDLFDNLENVEL